MKVGDRVVDKDGNVGTVATFHTGRCPYSPGSGIRRSQRYAHVTIDGEAVRRCYHINHLRLCDIAWRPHDPHRETP